MNALKRQQIYKQVNRDRDRLAKRMTPLWKRALAKQVESYNFATEFISTAPIHDAMQFTYVSVGGKFAIQNAKRILNKKAEDPAIITQSEIDLIMINMVNQQFAEKIAGISETTKKEIQAIIQEQLDLGRNPRDSARLITQRMAEINKSRALTIARTESIGASNAGAHEGAKALNIPLKKTWSAAFINTRSWHANASGQVRPFDSPFTVNGEQMRFPHDASLGAGADNIINCRCVSIETVTI